MKNLNKIKVAQIDTVYGDGSTGKIVETIHKFLLENNHESRAFYGRGDPSSDPGVIKVNHNFEVYIDYALSKVTGYNGIFSHNPTNRLIGELRRFKPDIVHLHEIHGYFLHQYNLLEFLKSEGIPIVWTLHCESAYTGRCGYAFDCEQWMTTCVKCPRLNDYPSSLFFDRSNEQFQRKVRLMSGIDLITLASVSNWLDQRLAKSFLKNKNRTVVFNGIDVKNVFYSRDYSNLANIHNIKGELVFLSVAPDLMSSRKGGRWVLELAHHFFGMPIKFIMIGVKGGIRDCPGNVIYLPPISDVNILAEYYSLADIFLITSQSETFSLTTAEALACGTPVLGFDAGGPSEVAPEPYGKFIPFGDIKSLISLIEQVASGSLSFPSSEDCSDYACKYFSNDRMCDAYLNEYQSLIMERTSL